MVTVRNAGAADKKFKMMEEEFSMDTFKGRKQIHLFSLSLAGPSAVVIGLASHLLCIR